MSEIFRSRLLCSVAGATLLLTATTAYAQEDDETADDQDTQVEETASDEETDTDETLSEDDILEDRMVVTGSRIAGASDSGAIAVSTITAENLEAFGQNSTGELLENIPQAGSFEINDSADGPNDARGDIATVNLRGLGTGNTLVLLNGRRITAHGINQDVGSVPRQVTNVNAFPAAAIDRVEILRDGASALYGSDATAGVVNTILTADYDGSRLTTRYGFLEGTDFAEFQIDGVKGFEFNQGQTKLLLTASYFTRNGLFATELDGQFRNVDKRNFLGNSPYATANNDFRNTSTRSPFGQFRVGELVGGVFEPIDVGDLTANDGDFHVQPCGFSGTQVEVGASDPRVGCVGLDDGNLNADLRFDFNSYQPVNSFGDGQEISLDSLSRDGRQFISSADRFNFYSLMEHDFANGLEAFGEVLVYHSATTSNRAAQPLDDGLAFIVVPRQNFWNPVGPIGSPNRVAGIDAPDEGLDVLISRWRPTEHGPRIFEVDSTTYRVLGGVRGTMWDWEWESAVGYSANSTTDRSGNRISKEKLFQELSKTTPDAINPFGGPNANSEEQLDRIRIDVENVGRTSLLTADFRVSNSDVYDLWAGPIGVAAGIEFRNEQYEEDRDPRLDGSTQFVSGTGDLSDRSDVVGVSPTADSDAGRNVYSAFAETLVPLWRGNHDLFVNELNLQGAVRVEYFDDIEDAAVSPKVALSWFPIRQLNFRAAYAEGFRAPNLVQLNRGDISRLNQGDEDFWRADVTGDPDDTGETFRASVRRSNPDLQNEDTETIVLGTVLDLSDTFDVSWIDELRFSVDYWRFEQTGVIDNFGVEEALALDFLLRQEGSFNPAVVRAGVTEADQAAFDAFNADNPDDQREAAGVVLFVDDPYINLDSQEADGFDFAMQADFDMGWLGSLSLYAEATKLMTLDIIRNEQLQELVENPIFAGEFDALAVDRIRLNGNPEWRASGTARWRNGPFGAGMSVRYVSGFLDTSADPDLNDDGRPDFFPVESYTRFNTYFDYRLGVGPADPLRIRFGINNITDERPPLADESRGFFTQVHSVRGREFYLQVRGIF